jgi:hypothetical protein
VNDPKIAGSVEHVFDRAVRGCRNQNGDFEAGFGEIAFFPGHQDAGRLGTFPAVEHHVQLSQLLGSPRMRFGGFGFTPSSASG